MQAKCPNDEFVSQEDVKTEILALLIATTDTTAAFICAFINHILDNPDVMTKLNAEIREKQTQGQLISPVVSFDETEAVPYFMACINETLRVSPSTPVTLPRIVSDGGLVLDDTFIPAGTEIGANPYVINRDRSVFGIDADDFNPERWFRGLEKTREMHKWIFTWGWGPRDCVGRHLARMLAQKLLFQVCCVSFQIYRNMVLTYLSCSCSKTSRLRGYRMKSRVVGARIEDCVSTLANGWYSGKDCQGHYRLFVLL